MTAKKPKTGGRQKGSRNKVTAAVKDQAARFTVEALDTLANIMLDGSEPAAARIAAAKELLDRAHGKAPQAHVGEEGGAIRHEHIHEIRRTIVDPQPSDA